MLPPYMAIVVAVVGLGLLIAAHERDTWCSPD